MEGGQAPEPQRKSESAVEIDHPRRGGEGWGGGGGGGGGVWRGRGGRPEANGGSINKVKNMFRYLKEIGVFYV